MLAKTAREKRSESVERDVAQSSEMISDMLLSVPLPVPPPPPVMTRVSWMEVAVCTLLSKWLPVEETRAALVLAAPALCMLLVRLSRNICGR